MWRTLSQRDAALVRIQHRDFDVDEGMAGHLSCMIYSAFVCPYWASSAGRLGKNSSVAPGAPRGTRPAIVGFRDILMLVSHDTTRPFVGHPDTGATNVRFGYDTLCDDLPFKDPEDLRGKFDAALAADLETIDLDAERAYWTDTPEDVRRLDAVIGIGMNALIRAHPLREVDHNGELRYAYALPLA